MKTTKKHFDIFKNECLLWVDKFKLDNWAVYLKHGEASKDSFATIHTALNGYGARIYFTDNWTSTIRPCNEEEIRLVAKHEVIHLLLSRLSEVGGTRFVTKDEIDEAEEELVNKLIKLL